MWERIGRLVHRGARVRASPPPRVTHVVFGPFTDPRLEKSRREEEHTRNEVDAQLVGNYW